MQNHSYPWLGMAITVFNIMSIIFPVLCLGYSSYLFFKGYYFTFFAGMVMSILSWFLFKVYAEGMQMFIDIAESAKLLAEVNEKMVFSNCVERYPKY